MANGINPLDDSPIPDNDIANNVRLSKCFFYVSDVLRQVIESGGIPTAKPKRSRKKEFTLTGEQRAALQISPVPLSVREISDYLNTFIDWETTKKLSATAINHWLLSVEALESVTLPNGRHGKKPTTLGKEIGIFIEDKMGQYGPFEIILFSAEAQQFIYDHLDAIVVARQEKRASHSEFQGKTWTQAQDECLIDLFQNNVPVSEIATTLKRSDGGVRARLKRLGLIEHRRDAK